MNKHELCPLCSCEKTNLFFSRVDKNFGERIYDRCESCDLVFLKPHLRLTPEAEKQRYAYHQNSPDDMGYVAFLNQLLIPLKKKIEPSLRGLDYGCGPGPTVSVLLAKENFKVENYDPVFYPNPKVLAVRYNFITCTEVIEHVHNPQEFMKSVLDLLLPKGILAIMTQVRYDNIRFEEWWYPKDPTHVCFFSNQTFAWIANYFKLKWESSVDNVIFFEK